MAYDTGRLVWRLSGKEPLAFLEATTTQDHQGQQIGETRWCCVLDPNGRVLAFLRSIPLEDGTLLLDGDPACEAGVAWLASIAPLSRCSIAPQPDMRVVAMDAPSSGFAAGPRSDGLDGSDVMFLDLPAEARSERPDEQESLRVEIGWPLFGTDITSDHLLNDTPLLELCTSFTKGCYRGQETVAKIANLGHARRAFARLRSASPIAAGEKVSLGDQEIGSVTSAAETPAGYVALALLKREALEEAQVTLPSGPAETNRIELAPPPPRPDAPATPPRMSRTFGRR